MAYFLQSLQYSNSASNAISTHLRHNNFSKTPLGNCHVYHKPSPNSSLDEILTSKNRKFGFSLHIYPNSTPFLTTSTNLGMGGTRKIQRYDLYNTHTLCHFHSPDGNKTKKLEVDINNVGTINSISSTRVGEDTCTALPLAGLDLSGRNFSGTCPKGADFTGANLTNVDFAGVDMTNVNFNGADITNVDFTSVKSFAGVNFTGCRLGDVQNANNDIDSPFKAMSFNGTIFPDNASWEVNFAGSDFRNALAPTLWSFDHCVLSNANFSRRRINQVQFLAGVGDNLNCEGLQIVGASSFTFTSMKYSVFNNASLNGARFSLSEDQVNNLYGSYFINADLTGANFGGAWSDSAHVHTRGANLTNVDFSGANLNGANLTYTNLTNANLTNADLTGANLTGAVGLWGDDGGVTWQNTTCADGSNSDNLPGKSCAGVCTTVSPVCKNPHCQNGGPPPGASLDASGYCHGYCWYKGGRNGFCQKLAADEDLPPGDSVDCRPCAPK